MSYSIRIFREVHDAASCSSLLAKLGCVTFDCDNEFRVAIGDSSVFSSLRSFIATPYRDDVLPSWILDVNGGCSDLATYGIMMIPLLSLLDWEDAVVVDPQLNQYFTCADHYQKHAVSVLERRTRIRNLRKLGLVRPDGSLVTPVDFDFEHASG